MAQIPWYQQGPNLGELPHANEPSAATAVGQPAQEPLAVYLGSDAMTTLDEAIAADPHRAAAGLLVGHPLYGPRRPFLLVTGIISSPETPEGEDDLRLSEHALETMREEWEQKHPGTRVLGWFHGRANRGVVITGYERFNHHRLFPKTWQIALLIDTTRNASRLYRWSDQGLAACDDFYFWRMDDEPVDALLYAPGIAASQVAATATHPIEPGSTRSNSRRLGLWLLLALFLGIYALIPQAPGSIAWLSRTARTQAEDLSALEKDLQMLKMESMALEAIAEREGVDTASDAPGSQRDTEKATASVAFSDPPNSNPGSISISATGDPTSTSLNSGVGSDSSPSPGTPSLSTSLDTPVANATAQLQPPRTGNSVEADEEGYVVQPGDTMWRISGTLLGDPWAFRDLARSNQIDDPNLIYPGQRLRVPDELEQE